MKRWNEVQPQSQAWLLEKLESYRRELAVVASAPAEDAVRRVYQEHENALAAAERELLRRAR